MQHHSPLLFTPLPLHHTPISPTNTPLLPTPILLCLAPVVTDKQAIARNYLRGWFFIDLISSLPLDYIITAAANYRYDSPSYLKASRALKVLRMTRLLTLLRLLRVTRMFRLFRRWEELFNVSAAWLRMSKLITMMLLMLHLVPMLAKRRKLRRAPSRRK